MFISYVTNLNYSITLLYIFQFLLVVVLNSPDTAKI
jgi:hypothetical protein